MTEYIDRIKVVVIKHALKLVRVSICEKTRHDWEALEPVFSERYQAYVWRHRCRRCGKRFARYESKEKAARRLEAILGAEWKGVAKCQARDLDGACTFSGVDVNTI